MVSKDCRYTDKHAWARKDGALIILGISDFAQSELGDILFIELPEVGTEVSKGDRMLSIESIKAVSEVYAPVSGKIEELNRKLENNPETINASPYGDGWICKIMPEDPSQFEKLLSPEDYEKFLAEET